MINILAVANQMLEVSDFSLSNLKLQKLLYYVYGINLVLNPDIELSEGPQAWDYGPVFPKVYRAFKKNGADLITMPAEIAPFGGKIKVSPDNLLFEIIESVYNKFGHLSELTLVRRTHQPGTPWDKYYQAGEHKVAMRNPTVKKYFQEYVIGN